MARGVAESESLPDLSTLRGRNVFCAGHAGLRRPVPGGAARIGVGRTACCGDAWQSRGAAVAAVVVVAFADTTASPSAHAPRRRGSCSGRHGAGHGCCSATMPAGTLSR